MDLIVHYIHSDDIQIANKILNHDIDMGLDDSMGNPLKSIPCVNNR